MGCFYVRVPLCVPVIVLYLVVSRVSVKWLLRAVQPTPPLCAGSAAGFAEILGTAESGTRARGRCPQCTFVKELRVCCHLPPPGDRCREHCKHVLNNDYA